MIIPDYFCNFAAENIKITIMNPTIDTYRLTSMEEPSDAVLSDHLEPTPIFSNLPADLRTH